MLNVNVNYPYPLLRPEPIDYTSSTFDAKITVEPKEAGYEVNIEYVINDEYIIGLIDSNMAAFGVEIQCKSTWFRKFETSKTVHQTVVIPATMIHDTVSISPCIVSIKDIEDFKSNGFTEEYAYIQFNLNCGEVIAIGNEKRFEAVYKMDIINNAESIINISLDEKLLEQECDFNNHIITVKLPKEEYDNYNSIGIGQTKKRDALIAIYCVPALVEAVGYVYEGECSSSSDYNQYAWYKTLKLFIEKKDKGNITKIKESLEQPIRTVQSLLNNNSKKAINILLRNEELG